MHFIWQLFGKQQLPLLRQLQLLIPASLGRLEVCDYAYKVRVHIGHSAVANFYSNPVKKLMQFVMRRKMRRKNSHQRISGF